MLICLADPMSAILFKRGVRGGSLRIQGARKDFPKENELRIKEGMHFSRRQH